jgi:hypothetical protein
MMGKDKELPQKIGVPLQAQGFPTNATSYQTFYPLSSSSQNFWRPPPSARIILKLNDILPMRIKDIMHVKAFPLYVDDT